MQEPFITIQNKLMEVPSGQLLMEKPGQESEIPFFIQAFEAISAGKGKAENFSLFPGISLTHSFYLADNFHFRHPTMEYTMQINHCRYGRIGWEMHTGKSIYLGPGDLSVHMMDACADSQMSLPTGYYEGIAISVDLNILRQNTPEILRDAHISGDKLREKFCSEGKTTAMPASVQIEHIFSELYQLSANFRVPYYKLKVQELLLFLSALDPEKERKLDQYLSPQVETVKVIHKRLTEHLNQRFTIEDLAKEYLINTSSLKAIFKTVYGAPIGTYMKSYRIHQSAKLLRETDKSIGEIAEQVGYESQSKFTVVFKSFFSLSPTAYRRQYGKK